MLLLLLRNYGGAAPTPAIAAVIALRGQFAQTLALRGQFDTEVASVTSTGIVTAVFSTPGYDVAAGLAIDDDRTGASGKIVLAGWASVANSFNFAGALARYFPDGSLDTHTFGNGTGKVTTTNNPGGGFGNWNSVAIQEDGKIVVAGVTDPPNTLQGHGAMAARFNADGTIDTTFGAPNGFKTYDAPGGRRAYNTYDLLIQPDGKLVFPTHDFNSSSDAWACVVRVNTDGSLDTGFTNGGTGGFSEFKINSGNDAKSVCLLPSGKIILAGATGANYIAPPASSFVAQLNANGTLDTANFNSPNGYNTVQIVNSGEASIFNSVRLQTVGGVTRVVAGGTATYSGVSYLTLARFNLDGTLDATFGVGGKVSYQQGSNVVSACISVAVGEDDGSIYASGYSGANSPGGSGACGVLINKYSADGSTLLWTTTTPFTLIVSGTTYNTGAAFAYLQDDGKLLAALSCRKFSGGIDYGVFCAARYNPDDGSLDGYWGGVPGRIALTGEFDGD